MINWPPRLIQDIARRRCVAFIGAGISRRAQTAAGSRPPMWRGFLDLAAGKCVGNTREIKALINKNDYLTACQLIKTRLGLHHWHETLEDVFLRPNYNPDAIHQAVFDLDLPIVATTNIDMIYDKFIAANYAGAAIIKPYHDEAVGRYVKGDSSTRLVLKVHGSVDNLEKTIFTREEYAEARYKYSHFYELLSSLVSTQAFLFLGYSLADPDINLLLEEYARRFKSPFPHYLVTSDRPSDDLRAMFESNYSINILSYNLRDDHVELVNSVAELSRKASAERTVMGSSLIW